MPRQVGKSPLTLFAEAVGAASPLRGVGIPVHLGVRFMPMQSAPPRIVLIPTDGVHGPPQVQPGALFDVEQTIIAHCWDTALDEAHDLRQRLIQAMDIVAVDGGAYWRYDRESWAAESNTDTSAQGVVLLCQFSIRLPVDRIALSEGRVDATQITRA